MQVATNPTIDYMERAESLARRLARLDRLLTAAERAYADGNDDACLIVLYALLDILGTVSRDPDKRKGDGADFRRWLDQYVLPLGRVEATSDDLWGARCGILHALSHESDHSDAGRARLVVYFRGEARTPEGTRWTELFRRATQRVPAISKVPVERIVHVHLGEFLLSVREGFDAYRREMLSRDELDTLLTARMDVALTTITVNVS